MTAKKEDLRKVTFTEYEDGSGKYVNCGYFHIWGTEAIPQDNGMDIPRTIAIVEMLNGKIQEIAPFRIKFVDEF